jgi:hypothetical protein
VSVLRATPPRWLSATACDVPVPPNQNKVLTTAVDSHIASVCPLLLPALARLVLLIFLQVPSIGDPNAGPHPATLQMLAYMPCTPFSCKDHPSYHRVSRGWSCHDLSTEVFLTCYFSARSPERHPLGCIVLRKWSSSTDKHIYCTISHVHLGYSVVIMRSVTISPGA